MNVLVKSDVIWIRPVPTRNAKGAIKLYIPKLVTEKFNGITVHDIVAGRGEYQLPEGFTADDVADIKVQSGIVMIDFN